MGRPELVLDIVDAGLRFRSGVIFSDAIISACGRYIVLISNGGLTKLYLVDTESKVIKDLPLRSSNFPPICKAIRGSSDFIVASGEGELCVINSERSFIESREEFGERCLTAAVNSIGNRCAVVTVSGVLRVREIPNLRLVTPDLPLPVTNVARLYGDDFGYFEICFQESGDILVGDFPKWRLPMSRPANPALIPSIIAAISNETGVRELIKGQTRLKNLDGLDWFDTYCLSRNVLEHKQRDILNLLKMESTSEIESTVYRQEFAYRILVLGARERDSEACRIAAEGLFDENNRSELNEEQVHLALGVLVQTSPEIAIRQIDRYYAAASPLNQSVMNLYRAKCCVAVGSFQDAVAAYSAGLDSKPFLDFEQIRPALTMPIRLEQVLALSSCGASKVEILQVFSNTAEMNDLNVVSTRYWIRYFLGLSSPVERDFEDLGTVGDHRMEAFVKLYQEFSRGDFSKSSKLLEELESVSSSTFQFDTVRPTFPFNRAHAALIAAEIAAHQGDRHSARDRVVQADRYWISWEDSAVSQGIDRRALWQWRIPFDKIRSRVMQLLEEKELK